MRCRIICRRLPKTGDPLEVPDQVVDFKQFRESLELALVYADGSKGGRPPYDPVVMFKILIQAARHQFRFPVGLAGEQTREFKHQAGGFRMAAPGSAVVISLAFLRHQWVDSLPRPAWVGHT